MSLEMFKLFFTGTAFLIAVVTSYLLKIDYIGVLATVAFLVSIRSWSEMIWLTTYIQQNKDKILKELGDSNGTDSKSE